VSLFNRLVCDLGEWVIGLESKLIF
jgi:hypothetical protein